MPSSPLGLLLIIAAIYLVYKSPKRMQTVLRMVIAIVATEVLMSATVAFLFRVGDGKAWGGIVGLVSLLVAVIVGWLHTRSAKATA